MIAICVKDASGEVLAREAHAAQARLCFDREYAEGDVIEIMADADEGAHLCVQPELCVPAGEVYLPGGTMTWRVPWGEHRLAYRPGAFDGKRHVVMARAMTGDEVGSLRDLARNPSDLRGDTDFYPHCTANVETRNESCFAARNVIDGLSFNDYHGEWPFESWGIGAREDAWCLLDLGREVVAEEMRLVLRADFPHDAYWVRGQVALSDGGTIDFDLERTGEPQTVSLGGRRVRWLRLQNLIKSDDPSAFPALRTWEVWGRG